MVEQQRQRQVESLTILKVHASYSHVSGINLLKSSDKGKFLFDTQCALIQFFIKLMMFRDKVIAEMAAQQHQRQVNSVALQL